MSKNWFAPPAEGEVSYVTLQEKAQNGDFHQWKFEPFESQENGYEDVLDEIKKYTAVDYIALDEKRIQAEKDGKLEEAKELKQKMEEMVDKVLEIYRSKDILPIQYFSEWGVMEEIEKCIAYNAKFDGDTVSCGAGIGTVLCNYLFPNIFDTPSQHDLVKKGARSLYEKFHNDEYLRRAIKFCFSYKDGCPVPTNVMGGLRLVGSAPTNFRPMNAKAVYERFCPEGGVIFDYCCVDDETEFFDGKKWKSLKDYVEGDKVLQYNENGTAELVKPIEYIHYKSDAPFYEYPDMLNLNMCVTGNHDVVVKDLKGIHKEKMSDILYEAKTSSDIFFRKGVPVVAIVKDSEDSLNVSNDVLLRTYGNIKGISDKHTQFVERQDNGNLSLSDNIFRLNLECRKKLLKLFGLDYKKDDVYVYINDSHLANQLVTLWNMTYPYCLSRIEARDASKVSTESTLYGYVLTIMDNDDCYTDCEALDLTDYNCKDSNCIVEVHKEDKYCFVVPSHMLVLRRKGIMFTTGNCGFGGRLLGALSSKKNFKYVGTDPCTETMYHLHELGEYIEQVTGRDDSYELHCCGSEVFRGPANSVDFAFSSPPYFNLEVYSDEPTQCFNKFPELQGWLEGFVRPTIQNIGYMLKPGAFYAVNIADFKVGGDECAYVDEWKRISAEEGMPLFDTVYLGVTARAGSKEQAAGELKKENILIFKKPMF